MKQKPYWWADSVAWGRDAERYDCDRTQDLAVTGTWMTRTKHIISYNSKTSTKFLDSNSGHNVLKT